MSRMIGFVRNAALSSAEQFSNFHLARSGDLRRGCHMITFDSFLSTGWVKQNFRF